MDVDFGAMVMISGASETGSVSVEALDVLLEGMVCCLEMRRDFVSLGRGLSYSCEYFSFH